MADNKVNFGIEKLYYSVITEGENGEFTYATPVHLPGAVEMTLDIKGETTDFFADNINYYTVISNQGYEGTISVANIPTAFRQDVLGETLSETDKVLTETSNTNPKKLALMWEFDGDVKATRHCCYYCTLTRPGLSGSTKTETAEPGLSELTFVAAPRPSDNVVKRSTTPDTTTTVYDNWFSKVYEPTA